MPHELEVALIAYDDPAVTALVVDLQSEYTRRYGGGDDTVVAPEEFAPPNGYFLAGRAGGEVVAIGGWRARDGGDTGLRDGDAELKRMYVVPAAQRRGFARALLVALERTARDAGRRRVVLETGTEQPEAIGLYTSSGYAPTTKFGHYAGEESSRCYAKELGPASADPREGTGAAPR